MNNPFLDLEAEIDLRRAIKAAYKHEGWVGIYRVQGELTQSLKIAAEVALEIVQEEKKVRGL